MKKKNTTQDYCFTGLFCHRFIRHIGPLYALLPHRCISFEDTKVKQKYCTLHLPQRTIFHTGLLHALLSHRSLQSANEPQKRETNPSKTEAVTYVTSHTGLITTQVLSPPRTITSKGLFSHRFIRHIGLSYALLPHRCISLKDKKVKTKNIARLICHKGLSSRKDHCMLYGNTGLYKALTSHKGENKPEHNRNYSRYENRGETNCGYQIGENRGTAMKTTKRKGHVNLWFKNQPN